MAFWNFDPRRAQDKLVLVLALVFGGLLLHNLFNSGPQFQGKPAKYWANELMRGSAGRQSLAGKALLELGSEASVPVLIEALESEGSPIYRDLWVRLPAPVRTWLPNPLVTAQNRYHMVLVLGEFGTAAEKAVPQLMVALQSPASDLKFAAAAALGKIGVAARPAIPLLESMAQDSTNNLVRSETAARALKQISEATSPNVATPK